MSQNEKPERLKLTEASEGLLIRSDGKQRQSRTPQSSGLGLDQLAAQKRTEQNPTPACRLYTENCIRRCF